MGWTQTVNDKVADSVVGRYFKIKERRSTFWQEVRGGLVTFLTVAYILPVNSGILTDTGGPCITDGSCPLGPGSLGDPACQSCLEDTRKSLISATAAACVISHFLMGVVGNLPLAVAPAMGLNAYFAYSVVGFMGTGQYGVTYQQALTAVFIEGFIFVAISLLGVRTFLVEKMPRCIMLATSAGIGLFLAHIGLQTAEGIGLVTYNPATLVTLGGCSPSHRLYQFTIPMEPGALEPSPSTVCAYDEAAGEVSLAPGAFVASGNYLCDSAGVMRSPTMWLGIASGLLMVALMAKQVKGALMIGIIFGTVIAWIPTSGNMAAYIGKYTSVPGAVRRMEVFEEVVSLPDTSKTALEFDFSGFKNGQLWLALITFLYVDFFDSTGTLYTMATYLTHYIPNFVNLKTKSFERQLQAYCVDGLSSVVGATLGSSPLTCYIESAAGIREGARTGLSSLVIMLCFVISLFFSPLIAAIPPYATGPALVIVGALMMVNIIKINWTNAQDGIPAFICIALMPLTYSIAYGIIGGLLTWIAVNFLVFGLNVIQAFAFPKSFPEEAMTQGGGSALKAAWWLTANPPRQEGLLEDIELPTNTDATLKAMTFRLHEGTPAEDDASAPTKPSAGASVV